MFGVKVGMKRRKKTVLRHPDAEEKKGDRDMKRMPIELKQSSGWTSPDSESDPSWRSVTPGL